MLPLYDKKIIKGDIPWVVVSLIFSNVFLFFIFLSYPNLSFFFFSLENIWNGMLFTIFTSLFIHVNFFHLIFNMWFLWVFGYNLEMKMGHFKFLIFYLVCGICGALLFGLSSESNLIGASGAISGLLGGYLILFPKNKIKSLFPPIYLPAVIYVFVWFVFQLFSIGQIDSSVAYFSHIGGFIAGILLAKKI
ncbi:MAG: rhomboid family intramembrane serine protease [Candidatus Pacebacteria bacterium]|nr:rhomboid family intramembrane serine protease [Candidatus Paceibacterota bacterium]MDD4074027.1 rhomboid family intramembrane serine protease [Candidatus Paceibacterota bacterium]